MNGDGALGDPMRGGAASCMRRGCHWPDICLFMRQQPPHVLSIAAADEHIIRLLQRSGLGCRGSSREGGAGGRDCPLPPLGRKWLSALTRYKSFIGFVVFLTKRSQSRNKLRRSIPSAPWLRNTANFTLSDGQICPPTQFPIEPSKLLVVLVFLVTNIKL